MEFYAPLPNQITSLVHKDLPVHVGHRLRFLWLSAHETFASSPEVSHRLSRSMMALVHEYGIVLYDEVLEKLCKNCFVLLAPSITCRVRLRPRSRQSPCNRGLKEKRLQNQLVRVCMRCHSVSEREPGQLRVRRLEMKHGTGSDAQNTPAAASAAAAAAAVAAPAKRKHSFMDSLHKRMSTPGTLDRDFISLADYNSKVVDANTGANRFLNLNELELINKKKRRKSGQPATAGSTDEAPDISFTIDSKSPAPAPTPAPAPALAASTAGQTKPQAKPPAKPPTKPQMAPPGAKVVKPQNAQRRGSAIPAPILAPAASTLAPGGKPSLASLQSLFRGK